MKLSQILNENDGWQSGSPIKVLGANDITYVQDRSWELTRWNATGGGAGHANDNRPLKRRIMYVRNIWALTDDKDEEENPLDNIEDKFEGDPTKYLIRGEAIYGHLDKGDVEEQLKSGYPWREFYGEFMIGGKPREHNTKFFWLRPFWTTVSTNEAENMKQLYLRDAQEIVAIVLQTDQ